MSANELRGSFPYGQLILSEPTPWYNHPQPSISTEMPAEEIAVRMENCRMQAELTNLRRVQAEMQTKLDALQDPFYGEQCDENLYINGNVRVTGSVVLDANPIDAPTKIVAFPANALRFQKQVIGLLTRE